MPASCWADLMIKGGIRNSGESMLCGIGIDIVSLDKIRQLWEKHRYRLCNDIFSDEELRPLVRAVDETNDMPAGLSDEQVRYLGTRFAAKEAALKALGAPHRIAFNWCDLEIIGSGHVHVRLHNEPGTFARQIRARNLVGDVDAIDNIAIAIIVGEYE
jgi:phosphopantetheine--protein transferase-like protein